MQRLLLGAAALAILAWASQNIHPAPPAAAVGAPMAYQPIQPSGPPTHEVKIYGQGGTYTSQWCNELGCGRENPDLQPPSAVSNTVTVLPSGGRAFTHSETYR